MGTIEELMFIYVYRGESIQNRYLIAGSFVLALTERANKLKD
jgi:hypothetical protein